MGQDVFTVHEEFSSSEALFDQEHGPGSEVVELGELKEQYEQVSVNETVPVFTGFAGEPPEAVTVETPNVCDVNSKIAVADDKEVESITMSASGPGNITITKNALEVEEQTPLCSVVSCEECVKEEMPEKSQSECVHEGEEEQKAATISNMMAEMSTPGLAAALVTMEELESPKNEGPEVEMQEGDLGKDPQVSEGNTGHKEILSLEDIDQAVAGEMTDFQIHGETRTEETANDEIESADRISKVMIPTAGNEVQTAEEKADHLLVNGRDEDIRFLRKIAILKRG